MRPLIAGNWKMNGLRAEALERAAALRALAVETAPRCDLVVCPPATVLAPLVAVFEESPVMVGAQDCHAEDKGAFTGDVAAPMIAELGCRFVIVGHSERRRDHGESDTLVAAKAAAAHRSRLVAIVCLGESAEERAEGRASDVVTTQLAGSMPPDASAANTVLAYEPIWAIGTGKTATPEDVAEVHAVLRAELQARFGANGERMRILYGGSVNAANARELLAVPHVDGALVGGASLKTDELWAIARSVP